MRTTLFFLLGLLLLPIVVAAESPDQVARAIEVQRQLLTENPTDADAFNDLGNLLLLAGHSDAALESYERATSLDDQLVSAHFNLGLLLAQRNQADAARQAFARVLELDPEHAWSHYQLGRLAENSGRTKPALAAYAEAFRLDPTLSFPDVNPQVIDSALTTRALLSLDAGSASASEAPRAYEDPFRIASLLLPQLPDEGTEVTPADDSADEPKSPLPPRSDSEEGDEPAASKTLSHRDLDPNSSVGEADPPAVTTGRDRGRRDTRRPGSVTRLTPSNSSGRVPASQVIGGYNPPDDQDASGTRSTGQLRTRTRPN